MKILHFTEGDIWKNVVKQNTRVLVIFPMIVNDGQNKSA